MLYFLQPEGVSKVVPNVFEVDLVEAQTAVADKKPGYRTLTVPEAPAKSIYDNPSYHPLP
jgi:hypothetical protein